MKDARLIWQWENDPQTRANSFTSDPILWEAHVAWLTRNLGSPRLLIAENSSGPVAFLCIDDSEVSINVAPEHRGKGVAKMALQMLDGPLTARIKPENVASQKAFEAAGFVLVEEGEHLVYGRG